MTPDDIRLIIHRLDEHGEKLDEIVEQAKITNGRIKRLELWQAKLEGVRLAINWPTPLFFTVLGGVLIFILTR